MQIERLVVKYVTVPNCFVYLRDTWLRKLETKETFVEILHKDKTYYASCIAGANPSGTLCIGSTFARALNIEEGDEVFVSLVKDVPQLVKITVVPHSENDREILELQMEKVQSTLLNQIRIVAKNQPIVAWVSKFSCVTLTTESLEPNVNYGQLKQLTEVHVTDPISKLSTRNIGDTKRSSNVNDLHDALTKFLPFSGNRSTRKNADKKQTENYKRLQNYRNKKKLFVFRVHPLPSRTSTDFSNTFDKIMRSPYHVFVPRNHASILGKFTDTFILFQLKKVPENRQNTDTDSSFLKKNVSSVPKLSTELTVRVLVLEDILEKCMDKVDENYFNFDLLHGSVYVSESLMISLKLKKGSKVTLRQIEEQQRENPSSIDIFSWKDAVTVDKFDDYVRRYLLDDGLLINSCAAIKLDDGSRCIVRISPEDCTFVRIDKKILERLIVHVRNVSAQSDLPIFEDEAKEVFRSEKISMRCLKNILSECQIAIDLGLGLHASPNLKYERENILICGEVGSGKSVACKVLSKTFQSPPYFVHTHVLDCRSLKGKKVEILQKIVTTALCECVYYEPSILFLDDLECITNASMNDEENNPDAINAARITDMLVNTVMQYQESHYVSIIATCVSVNRIGQKLRPARGTQFFRTVLSIPNLEKADRIDILQLMLGDKLCVPGDVNWDYYGNKTEGWMAQDLVDMAEKATFVAWKRHGPSKPPVIIGEEDMSDVLKNCTPMSLQGIQLYKGAGHVWSDIGGLTETKRSLVEILQWPLKYPELFKSAPIKLQNGILLYGMPGTGKTMLAKAIANECGVNLISVKGPELLSKYIGGSEESVRNVFERAHRAKPCVLFFDEFDSLAPRRGHDSTGVTDRVVNQLLTQLDGVEDREGVAVVAASSRPDLLDPALLRPGRLDKSLYCPLPNETEREEILAALCKTQKIENEELDLKELAGISSGFSGADLNAAITQARLSAFEDAVERASDGKVERPDIKVTQRHLVESIKTTHPSLSSSEKMKYSSIYARFSKGENITQDMLKNQKATLA